MASKFAGAVKSVGTIAESLIEKRFPRLKEPGVFIAYLFRDGSLQKDGAEVDGIAKRLSGEAAYYAQAFADVDPDDRAETCFAIEVSGDAWDPMDDRQKEALISRLLRHFSVTKQTSPQGITKTVLA